MVNSMTGFGRAIAEADGRELTVELKSVNHRYLDIGMRLPRTLIFLEDTIRSGLNEKLSRGHVDVYINYKNNRSDSRLVLLDEPLIGTYLSAIEKASDISGLRNDMTLSKLLHMPDLLTVVESDDDREAVSQLCVRAVAQATDALIVMRAVEGEKLASDIIARSRTLLDIILLIEERAPNVVRDYKDKLSARIAELLGGEIELDQTRLANEVAIFAEKADIDEEIVRLKSHISQLTAMLKDNDPAGRKLDFVVQEMNREMNTIGSKAADLAILDAVIHGKAEIEKIREQVQNIE